MKPGCTVMIPQDRGIHFNWGSVHHFSFFFFFFIWSLTMFSELKKSTLWFNKDTHPYNIALDYHIMDVLWNQKRDNRAAGFQLQCDGVTNVIVWLWKGGKWTDTVYWQVTAGVVGPVLTVCLFLFFFTHNACKTPRLEICMNNLPFFLLVKFRSNNLIFFWCIDIYQ